MKHQYRFFSQLVLVLFFFTMLNGCVTNQSEVSEVPDKKRTVLELYLTATEAVDFLNKEGNKTLFIDVRTPAEVADGMPAMADANVPIINKAPTKVTVNNNFVADIEARLKEKGLDNQSPIVLICRQGNRSALATNKLAEAGYKNVYHVLDGVLGWKKNDLPWTLEIDKDKMAKL
ncbi:MAG: rhodanese-like domain-containing protein [Candidatus Parabeggiatoa sp.]|nr:rhodanese-like domain-containing protein [Candidatus Parabeggiatoa sp.]